MTKTKKHRARRIRYRSAKEVHTVITRYSWDYEGRWVVKTNTAKYALNAALLANRHLHNCKYFGAVLAEVYDEVSSTIYAIIKVDLKGHIHTLYQDISIERDLQDQVDLLNSHKG